MDNAVHMTRIGRGVLSLVILALLGFTLQTVAFSGASFTAHSSNAANVFVTGSLLHINDQDSRVMISASGLCPGDSAVGTMTLTGTGTVSGVYSLDATGLVNVPASPRLSDALTLWIQDVTAAPVTLYQGTVTAFSSAALGTIDVGGSRTYRLTLAYPAGTAVAALQGASLAAGLRVTGVSQ